MKLLSRIGSHLLLISLLASFVQPAYGSQVNISATLSLLPKETSTPPETLSTEDGKSKIQFSSLTTTADTTITLTGKGEGTKVLMPEGLTMTAPNWTGVIDVSHTTTVPSVMKDIVSGEAVSIQFIGMEGMPVKLNTAAVVVIPYSNFGTVANPIVQITDMADTIYTLSLCSSTQYISGLFSNPNSYALQSYALAGAQHCYTYDAANVYTATNHFSTFMAGIATPEAAPLPPAVPTTSGGGGSSGNSSIISLLSSSPVQTIKTSAIAPDACEFAMIQPRNVYEDIPLMSWYSAAVTRLSDLGVLKKKKQTELFQPSKPLRRYEALMLTMDAFDIKPAKSISKKTYDGYLQTAKELGIIMPQKPPLSPLRTITRAEAVTILLRTAKVDPAEYKKTNTKRYLDVKKNQWHYPFMMKATDLCIIAPNAKTLLPTKKVTRSEFIVMLDRAVQRLRKS